MCFVFLIFFFKQKSARGFAVYDVATPEIAQYLLENGIVTQPDAPESDPERSQRTRILRSRSVSSPEPPGRRRSLSVSDSDSK